LSTTVNISGTTFWGSGAGSGTPMYVDGTSTVYCVDCYIGAFNSVNNFNALQMASGAKFYATSSTLAGNGTGAAVNAPSGANFIDEGGNLIQNCNSTTCNPVTPAQYATLGFIGGVIPKSSLTHTPNTCFAVTGALLATAQNLCTLLLDQNYQLLNITAQSGGTSPTAETCATPPVITLSDGTRSNTLTMTGTGTQTTWSVTGLSTIFASGTTLTVSIGANTCATPATNVSVNYVLQSVLNP
jgi:hypothetical protein